ncbi:MutS-related protein [Pseudobacter ginsenosidimutans]|jgi:DNA mismatch repair ATPase MutS|uniref:MutS-like protein n=1 Tax=Pseudobacter ginsenosidimutans TaxID=661488 RepID=A0A4Q7MEW8_9BACT|nr:DNA mismatch repair protein [Pseudobacter ginsenosidimutans]QEC45318.1 DNA mismatch repair protein [Pseudobacter ginsenosidimutans]RZS65588.1 MutS-like protein [Pseudobacter ginsenosidimutans]
MSFNTDKQTVDELNLLGKFRQGSVYHLFNHVKTRGGERLLDEMFRNPLQQVTEINSRSSLFLFFQQARLSFPFDVQQLNLMREYLDTGAGKNPVSVLLNTVTLKLLSSLTRDERYKKKVQGLQATIVTLNRCHTFLELLQPMMGPYAERVKELLDLLSDRRLEMLRTTDIYKALPVKTLSFYDHLLKTRFVREMEEVLNFIHELDLYIAVSDVARARGFTYAKALAPEKNLLQAANLGHPCIDRAIGNNIFMAESSNVVFLTGANMAGKSTLMKSIGIGMYLAHMGFPVAAGKFEFSVREGMYSSINVADNIGLGYSHFYAEVVRVKQAAEAAASGKRLLLMFDELFKGTNVKDAYDGTLAVTEAFAEYQDCLFIVSTHIIEVGEALKEAKNIQFAFMPTIMEGARPRYTYKLEEGITEDRQGMMIIRNEGILELIRESPEL